MTVQMKKSQTLALNFYLNKDYLNTIKYLSNQQSLSNNLNSIILAVSHMHVSNYKQAAYILLQIRKKIQQQQQSCEQKALLLKVLSNILIIYLVNCNSETLSLLEQIIQIVSLAKQKSHKYAKSLLKSVIYSLYGVNSIGEIQKKSQIIANSRNNSKTQHQLMSSLAIYSHIGGDLKSALLLQQNCYQKAKKLGNIVQCILSLRHLQQIAEQVGQKSAAQQYKIQLASFMNSEQLQGVSQATLFKNYNKKIDLASTITIRLMQMQQQLNVKDTFNNNYSKNAVIYKLKKMNKNQKAKIMLEILKQNDNILDVIPQSQFIIQSQKQYKIVIEQFKDKIKLGLIKNYFKQLILQLKQEKYIKLQNYNSYRNQKNNYISNYIQNNYLTQRKQTNKHQINFNQKRYQQQQSMLDQFYKKNNYQQEQHSKIKILQKKQKNSTLSPKIQKVKNHSKLQYRPKISEIKLQKQSSQRMTLADIVKNQAKIKKQQKQLHEQNKIEPKQQVKQNNLLNIIPSSNQNELKLQQTKIKKQQIQSKPKINTISQIGSSISKNGLLLSKVSHKQKIYAIGQKKLSLFEIVRWCIYGQYIQKRFYSSDGGAQRYLKLSNQRNRIYCAQDQFKIDNSSDSSGYKFQQIKGIVYGKVTSTMIKQCNKQLRPWHCFSLILKKRTLDIYCQSDYDLHYWLPGLSVGLQKLNVSHPKYQQQSFTKIKIKKNNKIKICINYEGAPIERFYSIGRLLWKKFLTRIKHQHIKINKKQKKPKYKCINAYAIVLAAKNMLNYNPSKLKI